MVPSVSGSATRWAFNSFRLALLAMLTFVPSEGIASPREALPQPSGVLPVAEALDVAWEGTCVNRQELAARVTFWLERELIDSSLRVAVRGRDKPALAAHFELFRAERRVALRAFDDVPGDCQDLMAALSFAIALAIDGVVEPRRPPRAQSPAGQPFSRRLLWLETIAIWDPTQGPVAGAAFGGGLSFSRFLVGAGLLGTLPHSTVVDEGRAKSWRVGGRAHACWLVLSGDVVPRLCLAAAAGALLARGEGYALERGGYSPWLRLSLRMSVMLRLSSRVRLGPGLDGEAWLIRPKLVLRDGRGSEVAARASRTFGVSAALNLETLF